MTKKKTTSADKNKSSARKKTTKPQTKQQVGGRSGWMKKLWRFGWKFGLTVGTIIVFYGFYLNSVIAKRFESQPYDLPTVVYARILTLSPGDQVNIQDVRHELDVLNYRKVSHPRFAGEYSASSSKIELIRRPFEFTDGAEPERHVMLFFNGEELTRIYSMENKRDLGFFIKDLESAYGFLP